MLTENLAECFVGGSKSPPKCLNCDWGIRGSETLWFGMNCNSNGTEFHLAGKILGRLFTRGDGLSHSNQFLWWCGVVWRGPPISAGHAVACVHWPATQLNGCSLPNNFYCCIHSYCPSGWSEWPPPPDGRKWLTSFEQLESQKISGFFLPISGDFGLGGWVGAPPTGSKTDPPGLLRPGTP